MSLFRRFGANPRVKVTELNMTPLIDCVFQLLLFFMVGMKFRELDRQLQATLPRGGGGRPPVSEVLIEIRRGGTPAEPQPRILIDRRDVRGWGGAVAWLRDYARLAGATSDPVILAPADDVPHGWVMRAFDILRQFRYENVNFKK